MTAPAQRLRAVLVNYNAGPWLRRSVKAAIKAGEHQPLPLEVFVVDNASTDDSLQTLADLDITIIRNATNRGYGVACNQATDYLAANDLLVFINPDCEVAEDCLNNLLVAMLGSGSANHSSTGVTSGAAPIKTKTGIVGAWVFNEDGSVQKATVRKLPTVGRTLNSLLGRHELGLNPGAEPAQEAADVEAVSGALFMMPVACFRALGGFDEGYFLHCEDLDLMRRARQAGWQIRLAGDARAVHAQGVSHQHAPLRAQVHKHVSLARYFSSQLGPLTGLTWRGLIWLHFVLRAPLWWWAGIRRP